MCVRVRACVCIFSHMPILNLSTCCSLVELCESRGSKSLQQFAVIFKGVGPPELPLETVELNLLTIHDGPLELEAQYSVPSLEDLG